MATPEDVRKRQEKTTVPSKDESVSDVATDGSDDTPETETEQEDVPMRVMVQRTMGPDGVMHEKVHGPMPDADWPEYERKHGL